MGIKKKYSSAEIVALYDEGKTPKEIATILGCSSPTVIRYLKEACVYWDGRDKRPESAGVKKGYHKVTQTEIDVLRLKKAGYSYTDISIRLGISSNTAKTLVSRNKKRQDQQIQEQNK